MEKTKSKHIELGEINYWLKVESSYHSSFIFTIVPQEEDVRELYQQQYVFQLENDADANRLTASRGKELDCETLYTMMKDALLMKKPSQLEYDFYFTNTDDIDPYEDDIFEKLEGNESKRPLMDTSYLFINIQYKNDDDDDDITHYWIPFEAYPFEMDDEEGENGSMMGDTTAKRNELENDQYVEVIESLEQQREESERREERFKKQIAKLRHKVKDMSGIMKEQQVQMDLQATKIEKLELIVHKLMETSSPQSTRSNSFSGSTKQPRAPMPKKVSHHNNKKKFPSVNRYSSTQQVDRGSSVVEDDEDSFAAHPYVFANHSKRRRSRARLQSLSTHRDAFFSGSTIVTTKQQQATLNKFYGNANQSWKLLYRASRNGWSSRQFHASCDHRGPTYVLIHTSNRSIFGGYCPVSICTPPSGGEQTDYHPETFLFSLKNAYGHPPTEFRHAISSSPTVSVRYAANTFIHFGHHELFLPSNPHTRKCSSALGTAFHNKLVKDEDTLKIYLAGATQFCCSDIEVWQPILEK